MKSATTAATASPLLLSARQQSSLTTIRIYSDPERQNLLQTIEAQGESSVTELGPPAVMACAMRRVRDSGCRYLAWFDRDPKDPSAGVDQKAEDITPEGDFPPDQDPEVCIRRTLEVNKVKQEAPLRRVEVVCV
ncbi:hypothetical protein PG991_007998 [Apiospora marii]|uniref:Uncharacterized protein n=1 Tax=Apiospora marii TaxID=335849 RepID=A0ABR1RV15_9PEZI